MRQYVLNSGGRLSSINLRKVVMGVLANNAIGELPFELLQLRELRELDVSGNPALEVVSGIGKDKGVAGIFEYIRDVHDDPKPSFSLKLLLAGPSEAGKTSLMHGLMGVEEPCFGGGYPL